MTTPLSPAEQLALKHDIDRMVAESLAKIRAEIRSEILSTVRVEVSRQFEGMSVEFHYDKLHGAS